MMTVCTGLLPEAGAAEAGPLSWSGGPIGCAPPLGAAGNVAGGDPVSGPSCIGATGALEMTGIVVTTRGGGLAAWTSTGFSWCGTSCSPVPFGTVV